MLVVLQLVTEEQPATFVHASETDACSPAWSVLPCAKKFKFFNFFGASDATQVNSQRKKFCQ